MPKYIVTRNILMKTKAVGIADSHVQGLWAEGREVELTKDELETLEAHCGKGTFVTPDAWAKKKAAEAEAAAA